MEYKELNGVRVYAPRTRDELIEYAFQFNCLLVAVNAEKILHATPETREIINRNLGYPDGIGAVIALKRRGLPNVLKIPGCELWLDIIRSNYQKKHFYLVGGKEHVIQKTVIQLRQQFPGIEFGGFRNGYLRSEHERQALIEDILKVKPDVVFVAMGSPMQELLMEEMACRHPAVYQGLGGSFDVYIGEVERAPDRWVRWNLEWLYRLVKQPSRIRRQIHLLRFVYRLSLNKL